MQLEKFLKAAPVTDFQLKCKDLSAAGTGQPILADERAIMVTVVGEKTFEVFSSGLGDVKARPSYRDCGLSDFELMSILGYTGDAYYSQLNSALRFDDAEALVTLQPILTAMIKGLEKLSDYHGPPVTRGWRAYNPALDAYQPGQIIEERAFLSAKRGTVWDVRVQMAIATKSCKYIAPLSFRQEEEVLCRPGTRFQIDYRDSIRRESLGARKTIDRLLLQEVP